MRLGRSPKELVSLQPDVLLAYATPAAAAFEHEFARSRVVFVSVSDPVGSGLVASLAQPDGDRRGYAAVRGRHHRQVAGDVLEIAPGLSRAALIAGQSPEGTPYDYFVRSAKSVAPSLAMELSTRSRSGMPPISSA